MQVYSHARWSCGKQELGDSERRQEALAVDWCARRGVALIPLLCLVVGGIVYSHLALPNGMVNPTFYNAVVGAAPDFVAWSLHDKFISRFEDGIPILKDLLAAAEQDPAAKVPVVYADPPFPK